MAVLTVPHKGVHVFHRHFGLGEDSQHRSEAAGTVVNDRGNDVTLLNHKGVVPEDLVGLIRVVDDQAENAKVGGVRQGQGAHINAVVPQNLGDLHQLAGHVFHKDRDLFDKHSRLPPYSFRLSMMRWALPSLRAMVLGLTR